MDLNYHIINDLLKEKKRLEQILRESQEMIHSSPEGTVTLKRHRQNIQFYHRKGPDDRNGIYLAAAERDLGIRLVQKRYLERLCEAIAGQLKEINRFLSCYDPDALKNVYISEHEIRKQFVSPAELPDDLFVSLWQQYEYVPKVFEESAQEHYTKKHERVRSKSEALIADALNAAGIPYRYECPLEVNRQIIHPDFTILRLYDRKILYWEHLGKLDMENYRKHSFYRIRNYEAEGIFPGDQLILTAETAENPLNNIVIEHTIRHYLLPH